MVADEAYGRQIPFAFLDRVRAEFSEKYAESSRTLHAHSLDKAFGCAPAARDSVGPVISGAAITCCCRSVYGKHVSRLLGWASTTGCCGWRRPRLKYWMDYCQEHPGEISKVASVQQKVRPARCASAQPCRLQQGAGRACQQVFVRAEAR